MKKDYAYDNKHRKNICRKIILSLTSTILRNKSKPWDTEEWRIWEAKKKENSKGSRIK